MGVWCMCVCVPVCLCPYTHMWRPEQNTECFYLLFLLFSPEAGSLPEPKAHQFGQAGVPGSASLSPPMLTSQDLRQCQAFRQIVEI